VNPRQIPSNWVAANVGMPDVCTRHGEPAIERRKLKLSTPTPGWAYVFLFFGVIPFLIVDGFLGRTMRAPAWPYCTRCKALRRQFAWGAAALFILTVVLTGIAALSEGQPGWAFLVAFVAFIGGVALVHLASTLARAELSQDGVWVEVKGAHRAFAGQVAAARQAAQAQAAQTHWTPAPPTQGTPAGPSAAYQIRR
jgi:hypothetical protein